MTTFDELTRMRLERGVEHLHRLGPRATAEFVLELSARFGELPAAVCLLEEYRARLTPAMLQMVGGHRFAPRPLVEVPPR